MPAAVRQARARPVRVAGGATPGRRTHTDAHLNMVVPTKRSYEKGEKSRANRKTTQGNVEWILRQRPTRSKLHLHDHRPRPHHVTLHLAHARASLERLVFESAASHARTNQALHADRGLFSKLVLGDA